MKGSEVQGSTYEAHDGFVWMVGEHKPARLEDEQVNRLLDVFQDAGAIEPFNSLYAAQRLAMLQRERTFTPCQKEPGRMERSALIVRRIDALRCELRIFSCNDGTVGARIEDADIRHEHTLGSLIGYGETVEEAVAALWQAVEDIDTGTDAIRIKRAGAALQYYRWNGAAWKEIPAEDLGYPAQALEAA